MWIVAATMVCTPPHPSPAHPHSNPMHVQAACRSRGTLVCVCCGAPPPYGWAIPGDGRGNRGAALIAQALVCSCRGMVARSPSARRVHVWCETGCSLAPFPHQTHTPTHIHTHTFVLSSPPPPHPHPRFSRQPVSRLGEEYILQMEADSSQRMMEVSCAVLHCAAGPLHCMSSW